MASETWINMWPELYETVQTYNRALSVHTDQFYLYNWTVIMVIGSVKHINNILTTAWLDCNCYTPKLRWSHKNPIERYVRCSLYEREQPEKKTKKKFTSEITPRNIFAHNHTYTYAVHILLHRLNLSKANRIHTMWLFGSVEKRELSLPSINLFVCCCCGCCCGCYCRSSHSS